MSSFFVASLDVLTLQLAYYLTWMLQFELKSKHIKKKENDGNKKKKNVNDFLIFFLSYRMIEKTLGFKNLNHIHLSSRRKDIIKHFFLSVWMAYAYLLILS